MGVGALPEFFVPRRAFGLQGRPMLTPDDVRVMGGRAIETGREIRNIPEDFRAGQEGFRRESNVFDGETIGSRAQRVADDLGDVIARREMQGLSPIPGIPDIVSPETRMYAVRQPNAGQMIKETDLPDIKYVEANPQVKTVGLRFEENLPYVDEAYPHNTRAEYYRTIIERNPSLDAAYRAYADDVYMQMFPDAPDIETARRAYNNTGSQKSLALDQMRIFSEFAESPEAMYVLQDQAEQRERAIEEYNRVKNTPKSELKTPEEKEAHRDRIDELELNLLQKDYAPELNQAQYLQRIMPPNSAEYMRRANAARKYILGEFRNDIAKYIGTSQGPQMELAKRGITIPTKKELLENLTQITSGGSDFRDLKKKRTAAGFNPEGEMQPLISKAEVELMDQQETLNELNAKRNALREQHYLMMPEEPDPAKNPTEIGAEYRALKNPMDAIIDKMTKTRKQLENFTIANAYETISDIAFQPRTAREFREEIPYPERQFFPNLFAKRESGELKTPDEAPMFNVRMKGMRDLGIDFLATQYTNAMLDGRVPIDDKGKPAVSVEKFIEQITKRRLKEEEKEDFEKSRSMVRLNDFAQETLSKIPRDLQFENSSVLELTKESTEDAIRRQQSFDCMVLNHCIGATEAPHPGVNPFTGDHQSHSYPVDPATGKDRGDRKFSSRYMKSVISGNERSAHFRDNITGLPVVTINMDKTGKDKYNLDFVSGYKNEASSEEKAKYAEDIKNYLNARLDIIEGSGSSLGKWGIFDMKTSGGQAVASTEIGVPKSTLGSFDLPRFVTMKDLRDLAGQQPKDESHAGLVARRNDLIRQRNELLNRGEDSEDLVDEIGSITQELNRIQSEVRLAPSMVNELARTSLFQRMTTEALTNGLGQEDGGIGPVRARVDDLLTDDFYGLREFWSDDIDFYPGNLRRFTNAVRNSQDLPSTLTDVQDLVGDAPEMRERLGRFQDRIIMFTPMQRELLVRELDNYAEANLFQLFDNLNPDDRSEGMAEYFAERPETQDYLEEINRRRNGQDFQQAARTAMPVPRDIANQVVPMNQAFRDQTVQEVTEALNNSVRNLPEDRETLIEALQQYQRNPLDIPGSIEMILPTSSVMATQNENRRTISNYLIQQIQNRLGETPATSVGENVSRAIDSNRQALTQTYPHQINNFELIHNDAQNNAVMAARQGQDANNAYLDTIQTHIDRLRRGRQTTERVELMPLVQEFYDDVARATARDGIAPARLPAPQRSTAVRDMVGTLSAELYRDIEANRFDIADMTSTLHALDARNFDHPMVRALPEADRAAAQEDTAATLRLILQNRNINIPVDIFAGGIPGEAPQLPVPADQFDETITTYRDLYTNPLTGSNHAFDQVMLAERATPGAINLAITRTDGDARYDEELQRFYNVDSPAGISQLNNALRRYMEGNGFDTPPRPVERPVREDEYVYDPDDMVTEIDYEMERQERRLTRNQYGRLDDLVDEIQREAGDNFEDLIDTIDRIRMRQGVDGDVDMALGDIRARLIRTEEASRLEFDRQQRNAEERNRDVVVEPSAALQGSIDAARVLYGPEMGAEIVDLVDNLINDDIRFDREPDQFIARLRDESNEYEGHNQGYSDAVREMADFLENYMRERAANRPQGRKRGGYIKKMNGGGKVQPSPPATSVNDHKRPVEPVKKIINPDAPEFKEIFNRERANRSPSSGGGSGAPADLKQIMNPRNITYNAGGKVSIDQMRYELLRKR
jgi:hypothetical protein